MTEMFAPTKHCPKCGVTKVLSEYYRERGRKDGLASHCKQCRAAYGRKYRTLNSERVRVQQAKWSANNPDYWAKHRCTSGYPRKYKAMHKERIATQGAKYYAKNRAAKLAYQARRRAAHPEKAKERDARWRRENPEKNRASTNRYRARKRNAAGDATAEQITGRWEVYGSTCYICGAIAEATDHVKPIAAGGSNFPANLRPICQHCNSVKHSTWPYDFVAAKTSVHSDG